MVLTTEMLLSAREEGHRRNCRDSRFCAVTCVTPLRSVKINTPYACRVVRCIPSGPAYVLARGRGEEVSP